MFPDASFESGRIKLNKDDIAVLFTAGIPEGRNTAQKEYSDERLKNLVIDKRNIAASQLKAKILSDVETFTAGAEQADDITLVVIKRSR